jgi:anhydro-N-acetylmuramic acid kinase
MKALHTYHVLGLMSGTSLDGLDVAYCKFRFDRRWTFNILSAKTFEYSGEWRKKLSEAHLLDSFSLHELHSDYGKWLGLRSKEFLTRQKLKRVDFIASHGHTIFHQPARGFTFQLGDGAALHAASALPVIYDFRSLDVALGGEGAPLVPIGDRLLFSEYDVCLNLGGIANLSMEQGKKRIAFDVCFCNMALNYLANELDLSFDRNGKLASQGNVNSALLDSIMLLYKRYRKGRPSLSREMFEQQVKPLLENSSIPLEDRLRTVCQSIATEIAVAIPKSKNKLEVLATGGGALSGFLVKTLADQLDNGTRIIVPPEKIIAFKEAMVFAFLGVRRVRREVNALASVTRAVRDSSGGAMVGFK